MALKILHAGHDGRGVYLGGWNIAPDGYLIHHATSFDDAWETLIADMAQSGYLSPCEHTEAEFEAGECDCDDTGEGLACTSDVVMRVVRPTYRD